MKPILILTLLVLSLTIFSFSFTNSPKITGKIIYSNATSAFQIETSFPFQNIETDEISHFYFKTNENVYCKLYTNYTGSWEAAKTKILTIKDKQTVTSYNMTNPGIYEWNILCENFDGTNDTWAHKRRRTITIINQTNQTNETLNGSNQNYNQTDENVTLQDNQTNSQEDNESDEDNTAENSNLEDNQSENNQNQTQEKTTCNGCKYNQTCYKINTVININSEKHFCNAEKTFEKLKENGKQCKENFQCKSNYCLNEHCRTDNFLTSFLASFGFV
jgi:hypothetical protein